MHNSAKILKYSIFQLIFMQSMNTENQSWLTQLLAQLSHFTKKYCNLLYGGYIWIEYV